MKKKILLAAAVPLALLGASQLTGCGGGGGTAAVSPGGAASVVSGTASAGALLSSDLVVTAKGQSGDPVECTETAAAFTCDVDGLTAPYVLKAIGKTGAGKSYTLYSAATAGGTANVNPLTNLAVASAVEGDPANAYAAPATVTSANLTTAVQAIRDNILQELAANGYTGANEDPFTASISEGQGVDQVFDYLDIAVTSGGGFTIKDRLADSAVVMSGAAAEMSQKTLATVISPASLSADVIQAKLIAALKVAEKVSTVDTAAASGGAAAAANIAALRIAKSVSASDLSLDPTSDYYTDETETFVDDPTTEAFEQVNEILCLMGQTRYDQMLNKGDYRAQVDLAQCESGRDDVSQAQESSSNQSSGSNMPEYEHWTVNSSRADNQSPQVVKAWIHESGEGEEPDMMIMAKFEITEGKSDINPYGLFTGNFIAFPVLPDGTLDIAHGQFKGFLKTEKNNDGKVAFKYAEQGTFEFDGQAGTFSQLSSFTRSPDGSTGRGTVKMFDPWMAEEMGGTGEKSFNFAFDETNFRRVAGSDDVCLSRVNYRDIVWRYGMYTADASVAAAERGDRVTLNSGFPIKYTAGDGSDYHGWAGYWGIWLPEEANLPASATVYKEEFGPDAGAPEAYTLETIGGKLIRHTRKSMTLANLKGIPMEYWDNATGDQYRVEYDGTNFKKVSKLTDQMNWQWSDWNETLSLSSLQYPELNFWSQSLGGQVRIRFEDPLNNKFCTPDGDPPTSFDCSNSGFAEVVFYAEKTVYPGETVPATLACFENCPDGANIDTANPVYADTTWDNQGGQTLSNQAVAPASAQYHGYTFSGNVLKDQGATDVVRTVAGNGDQQYGVNSGPLLEPTDANLAKLACDWDQSGQSTCAWQAWNLDEYFTWETGTNQWNKMTILTRDSDNSVAAFDPPLMVTYQVPNPAPTGIPAKLAGAKFQLDYQGFGELHGIPGVCTNRETGEETNCGPGTDWKPQFSIPSGATVTDGGGKTYLVKALEKGQRMLREENGCTSLEVSTQALPTIDDWEDPALGDEPTVTDPPAVIGGVLQ